MNRGAIAAEAGYVVASALIDLERRIDKLERVVIRLDTQERNRIPVDVVYSDGTRPSAALYPPGTRIWNSDDNAPNWSDGASWRDAAGSVT